VDGGSWKSEMFEEFAQLVSLKSNVWIFAYPSHVMRLHPKSFPCEKVK
jgi:hypothetical protein